MKLNGNKALAELEGLAADRGYAFGDNDAFDCRAAEYLGTHLSELRRHINALKLLGIHKRLVAEGNNRIGDNNAFKVFTVIENVVSKLGNTCGNGYGFNCRAIKRARTDGGYTCGDNEINVEAGGALKCTAGY